MLEYAKIILKKVSFNLLLFEKELVKAIDFLSFEEIEVFKIWCYQSFNQSFWSILKRSF